MTLDEALRTCVSPLKTACVFNPTRPEYYRANEVKAAVKASNSAHAGASTGATVKPAEPAVTITLSDQARAALKG